MSIEATIAYHKAIADVITPLYSKLQSFTNGILARVTNSDRLAKTVYNKYSNSPLSLERTYWEILSEFDSVLCNQVLPSTPLTLREYYMGTKDEGHIWNTRNLKEKGVQYQFTKEDTNVMNALWADVDVTINIIKATRDYGHYGNKLHKKVIAFKKKVEKVKLEIARYNDSHNPTDVNIP